MARNCLQDVVPPAYSPALFPSLSPQTPATTVFLSLESAKVFLPQGFCTGPSRCLEPSLPFPYFFA